MANVFSKLSGLKIWNSVDHNCYESIHTWDPSCSRVLIQLIIECMKAGPMLYLPIFFIPQLLAIKWRGRDRKIVDKNNMQQQEDGGVHAKKLCSSDGKGNATKEAERERKCDASASLKHPQDNKYVSADLMREIADRFKAVVKKISISSAILASNSSLVVYLCCIQNRLTGKVFYLSPFISAAVAHFFSFRYETASRRNALAMFAIKTSFEILYRMLRDQRTLIDSLGIGSAKNENAAAVLLFASSMALNFYFLNQNSSSRDPLMQILTLIIGPEGQPRNSAGSKGGGKEAGVRASGSMLRKASEGGRERNVEETNSSQDRETREAAEESMPTVRGARRSCGDEGYDYRFSDSCENASQSVIHKESRAGNQDVEQEDSFARGVDRQSCNHSHQEGKSSACCDLCTHSPPSSPSSSPLSPSATPSCRHALLSVTSCPSYALTGSAKMFMIGWTIQVSLNLLKKRKQWLRNRHALLQQILLDGESLKFGFFLSNLVLVYRCSSCALHRLTGRLDDPINMMISGFSCGFISMFFYPSTQIALYTFWKTVFTMYVMAFGDSKTAQSALDALFCLADSFVINCLVMEPHCVPRSFLRFVDSITGSYLARFNIVTMYLLGKRDNGFRYGTRFPELKADHVSKRYLETIASWSLERQDV